MKKSINFLGTLLIMALLAINLNAASLKLIEQQTNISGTSADEMLISYTLIKNLTFDEITVKMKLFKTTIADGHEMSICIGGLCFPAPSEYPWTAGKPIKIKPLATSEEIDFNAKLLTHGHDGKTVVTCKFYNASDDTDSDEYTITYQVGVAGVEEQNINTPTTVVTQNPIDGSFLFQFRNYNFTSQEQLDIFNSNGERIRSLKIDAGTNSTYYLNSELSSGVYFYHVSGSSEPVKSFIVTN